MRLFNKTKSEIGLFPPMQDLMEKITEERKNWQTLVDYWKASSEREEKRHWELVYSQANIEFIYGNRETGLVWRDQLENFPNIKIGDIIKSPLSETDTRPQFNGFPKEFAVDRFDAIITNEKYSKGSCISFYVTEKTNT